MIDFAKPPAIIRPAPKEIIRPGGPRFDAGMIINPYVFSVGGGGVSTAFSTTLTNNDGSAGNYTYRVLTPTLTAGGTQIRVRFVASGSSSFVVDNASIGISSGSGSTASTPVELLFSGVSGFTITAGNTLVSDWVTLTTTTSDAVVVIFDFSAGTTACQYASGNTTYFKSNTNSYNTASISGAGFSSISRISGFNLIEVQ